MSEYSRSIWTAVGWS